MNAKEIRELFQKHQVSLSKDDVWEVRPGTPVVKHPALERLAAILGIEWGPPQILRAEKEEAVLIATGKIGDGQPEWSIGEAVVGQNYKVSGRMAAYPFAMAEKRAKDRVILKLAGLHGAYSEEEADDFKQRDQAPQPPPPQPKEEETPDLEAYVNGFIARIKVLPRSEALDYAKNERRDVWREYGIDQNDEYGRRMAAVVREITSGVAA